MSDEIHKIVPTGGEVLIYKSDDGRMKIDIRLVNETLWMTQSDMAQLFQCSADNISLHLRNIYEKGELELLATTEEFSVVRPEGKRTIRRKMIFYNLDAVQQRFPEIHKPDKSAGICKISRPL